jgi:hypothetical protein
LQRLYDDLGQWREVYGRDARREWGVPPPWQYEERFYQLADVQHQLLLTIDGLHGLVDLS